MIGTTRLYGETIAGYTQIIEVYNLFDTYSYQITFIQSNRIHLLFRQIVFRQLIWV